MPGGKEGNLGLNVALIGLSGAGKTTVAPLAAARLGFPWIDLDLEVERAVGRSVRELFAEGSVESFRALETEALQRELAKPRPGLVVACGGGIVTARPARELLQARAFVVWLRVRPERAAARLGAEGTALRPLLSSEASGSEGAGTTERLATLLRERAALYETVSDAILDTDGRTPGQVADEIVALCRPDPTWP